MVDSTYHPAAVLTEWPKVGRGIETVAASHGQERSSSFFVNFSGYQWRVRKVPSNRGGTSNPYYHNNVYVDQSGALHLQIVNRNNQWTCSEVNLTRSLGYGTYAFTVEDTSNLDPAAFFEMFTWDHSSIQGNHGEFDIDISRWGAPKKGGSPAPTLWRFAFVAILLRSQWGRVLQRLFSTFANGLPGVGLLLQRVLTTILLVRFRDHRGCGQIFFANDDSAVDCGLRRDTSLCRVLDPVVGTLIPAVELWIAFANGSDPWIPIALATLGATIAMIGPGAWSIDARLFGRKHLTT